MKSPLYKLWTGWIRCYPYLRAEPNGTGSNTFDTELLSLYAALDVKTGKVHGKTAERHTGEEFVAFLDEVVALCAPDQEIHVIADNLSAHKTAKVATFLQAHPRVQLHFTPTYSSWLNQVEIWFARIEREVIARGVFTSVEYLSRKLMRYIRAYSKTARPFRWKYANLKHRITYAKSITATQATSMAVARLTSKPVPSWL